MRKLLLHKKEIDKMFGKMKEQGITLVPLQVYFKGSLVKMEIGVEKERNCMISGTILLKKIKNRKHRENLRSETYSVAAKGKKNCGVWERNCYDTRH